LENILRLQRLLQPAGASTLDERAEHTIGQMLADEKAKLAGLDDTEPALQ
jgi:hypothetical protein